MNAPKVSEVLDLTRRLVDLCEESPYDATVKIAALGAAQQLYMQWTQAQTLAGVVANTLNPKKP